jgi:hypothetical protein
MPESEAGQAERAILLEVGVQVVAVQKRRSDQRSLAGGQNCHVDLTTVPYDGCLMDIDPDLAPVSEAGGPLFQKREAQSPYRRGRQSERAVEAGVDHELKCEVGLAGEPKDHVGSRLQPDYGPTNHGAVRFNVPPSVYDAS